MKKTLIQLNDLSVTYPFKKRMVTAAKNITFNVDGGETVGLVGESGCGKSTIGKALLKLVPASSGKIIFENTELTTLSKKHFHPFRKKIQIIFQDPYSSLNPKMNVETLLSEPLIIHQSPKPTIKHTVEELMEKVRLPLNYLSKKAHELSGGQRQRVSIARAIALKPQFIFCDEPVSSLDSVHQSEVIDLLKSLQESYGVSYLFVSHDLSLVTTIAHNVAVMYLGEIIEWAPGDEIENSAVHPYTQALFSAAPIPNPRVESKRVRIVLKGEIPSILNPPSGCPFHTRCPSARDICRQNNPEKKYVSENHWAKCHFL